MVSLPVKFAGNCSRMRLTKLAFFRAALLISTSISRRGLISAFFGVKPSGPSSSVTLSRSCILLHSLGAVSPCWSVSEDPLHPVAQRTSLLSPKTAATKVWGFSCGFWASVPTTWHAVPFSVPCLALLSDLFHSCCSFMSFSLMALPLKALPLLSHLGGLPPVAPVLIGLEEDEDPNCRTLAARSSWPKSPKWPGWTMHVFVDSFITGFVIIASTSHPVSLPTAPWWPWCCFCSSASCFGSCFPTSCCLLATFSLALWISLGSLTPKKTIFAPNPATALAVLSTLCWFQGRKVLSLF